MKYVCALYINLNILKNIILNTFGCYYLLKPMNNEKF